MLSIFEWPFYMGFTVFVNRADAYSQVLLYFVNRADAYSDRQDELDLERKEKYKHWNRRKDEEMRRRLLQAYRPYFPNDVFHTGQGKSFNKY